MTVIHSGASAQSWWFVKHFWHVPMAIGLILQLLCSPIGNWNFRTKAKHHDCADAPECSVRSGAWRGRICLHEAVNLSKWRLCWSGTARSGRPACSWDTRTASEWMGNCMQKSFDYYVYPLKSYLCRVLVVRSMVLSWESLPYKQDDLTRGHFY